MAGESEKKPMQLTMLLGSQFLRNIIQRIQAGYRSLGYTFKGQFAMEDLSKLHTAVDAENANDQLVSVHDSHETNLS